MSWLRFVAIWCVFALHAPLYLLTRYTPRDPNLWVFGGWFGNEYSDNPRYLAEYLLAHHPEVRCVWLGRSEESLQLARAAGLTAVPTFGPRGYWYTMRAGAGFICTGRFDINFLVRPPVVVNLWHGIPLKKIVADHGDFDVPRLRRLLFAMFPFFYDISLPMTVSSSREAGVMATAFRMPMEDIHVTGSPRNDCLGRRPTARPVKVAYLPTHRGEGHVQIHPLATLDLERVTDELDRLGVDLDIKVHYYHAQAFSLEPTERVHLVTRESISHDTYRYLDSVDILITDYSSVYLDFLLTDRPIIFAPFDIDSYVKDDREFYWSYGDVTPGQTCMTWDEVLVAIERYVADPTLDADRREAVRASFHQYGDQLNAERVVELTRRLQRAHRSSSDAASRRAG